MVSSDIAVAGRCGAVAEGHGRTHLIRTPCGWRRFDGNCLQAQTNALGKQETRETRKMKASFYTQWQKTDGAEAWARLEQYTGRLT